MNHLVVIGYMSIKRAYLNIPRDQAIKRFMQEEGETLETSELLTKEFDFDDVFGVYDGWSVE